MKYEDLTGKKFGCLKVLKKDSIRPYPCGTTRIYWLCECDCGKKTVSCTANLKSGHTLSCGCLANKMRKNGLVHKTHGLSKRPSYKTWKHIKDRCLNPNSTFYKDYGGRGISIFEPWKEDFNTFYGYVSKLPHFEEKGYSIDRINNDGNYEPGNVRWATRIEQNNNTRRNVFFEVDGKKYSVKEYANEHGLTYKQVHGKFIQRAKERRTNG